MHLFEVSGKTYVLVANGSRVFHVDANTAAQLRAADSKNTGDHDLDGVLHLLGLSGAQLVTDTPLIAPPLNALSLAIAQKCNLGCSYCYAREGAFGGEPKSMDQSTAFRAVDVLFRDAIPGHGLTLTFLGGEPLANRSVLRATTERAAAMAAARGLTVQFSITTNGTLLSEDDADFFERYGFAVTVSMDGSQAVHDRLRPFKNGRGSYDVVLSRVRPLLARQRRMQVSARVTVTPRNLDLHDTLDELLALGFHSVGFSPMLSSPTGVDQMGSTDLERMLEQMIACGEEFERRLYEGLRYPFTNLVNALREIHNGTHRPYACGAGAGYLGVSADGQLSACHRFVGDPDGHGQLGTLESGVDRARQSTWLRERHVHRQEPCRQCWARYLCGGGCPHEVIHRGRPACDFIRGWLHYCLQAYIRTAERVPDWYGSAC